MPPEVPFALVTFDPAHANADNLVTALRAKFPGAIRATGLPGSLIVALRPSAPDADARMIDEETIGQDCPATIAYPRLYR